MAEILCPSCGGAVPVRRAASRYVVCPYCQSLIARTQGDLALVGQSAVLPFDVSPIVVGLLGTADGLKFEVVGRVRWGWSDGAWNEWLLAMADGTTRWLGEAMGTFMLLTEAPQARDLPAIAAFARGGTIAPGTRVTVNGRDFVAADVKQARCLGGEGELPFATPVGATMTSIDFRSADGGSLSIQRDAHETGVWLGRYVDLKDLAPKNLRRFDDWAMPEGLQ